MFTPNPGAGRSVDQSPQARLATLLVPLLSLVGRSPTSRTPPELPRPRATTSRPRRVPCFCRLGTIPRRDTARLSNRASSLDRAGVEPAGNSFWPLPLAPSPWQWIPPSSPQVTVPAPDPYALPSLRLSTTVTPLIDRVPQSIGRCRGLPCISKRCSLRTLFALNLIPLPVRPKIVDVLEVVQNPLHA